MKKQWLSIALGIVTATGGFLDAGTIATAGEAGAKFGLGLIWVILVATIAIILLVEMVGRFSAVSKKTYAEGYTRRFWIPFLSFAPSQRIDCRKLDACS
jgi:Mn2+/Fe2+ NRAMP family transporter